MSIKQIKWGIIGAGNIAHKLVDAVDSAEGCQVVAVASKSIDKARQFAAQYGIDACADYLALVERDDIDIVYVATTHNFHFDNAHLALSHNKNVLVEKPFTVNAAEARDLVQLARSRNLFLMEAQWTRFLPSIRRLREVVQSGGIGDVRYINITFGSIAQDIYINRLTDPALAGGALLDMGFYPISLANYVTGALPVSVQSMMRPAETGVDEISAYQFQYADNCLASIVASYNLMMRSEAMICGTQGFITFPKFQQGQQFTLYRHTGKRDNVFHTVEEFDIANASNGFIYQVEAVANAIRLGEIDNDIMPLSETIGTMALMDEMRDQWNFKYPFE